MTLIADQIDADLEEKSARPILHCPRQDFESKPDPLHPLHFGDLLLPFTGCMISLPSEIRAETLHYSREPSMSAKCP